MRKFFILIIIFSIAFVGLVQSECTGFDAADWDTNLKPLTAYFGLNDGGGKSPFQWSVFNSRYTNADMYINNRDPSLVYQQFWMINQAPIIGGINMTDLSNTIQYSSYTPTASFTCLGDQSGMWGPAYADFKMDNFQIRSSHPNIEVYVHYSAPNDTSYIRTIFFIKNKGADPDRVRLWSLAFTSSFATDVSPIDNNGRYYTAHSFEMGDKGVDNTNVDMSTIFYPVSIHVRGPKGLDQSASVFGDMYTKDLGTAYLTVLGPGEEFAFMSIMSFGTNVSLAKKNAAEIDAEPENIFHYLTADQLSMIRNWGGCQVVIGPATDVTVTPPSQCSSGLTSDFTVEAISSRTDLTANFTHRVLGMQGKVEFVAPQLSTTLTVPNDVGAMTHQLWYKSCLVKETEFTACTKAAPPVAPVASATPVVQTVPVAKTPPTKTSNSASLTLASVVVLVGFASLF